METVEISKEELERLKLRERRAQQMDDLETKIMDHQQEDDSDLTTIGELVLTELDLWM